LQSRKQNTIDKCNIFRRINCNKNISFFKAKSSNNFDNNYIHITACYSKTLQSNKELWSSRSSR